MSKIVVFALSLAILLSACAFSNESAETETTPDTAAETEVTSVFEINYTVDEGQHHRIVSHGGKKTTLDIFDKDGNTIYEEYNDLSSVSVEDFDDYLIVHKGFGNGPHITRYYSIADNVLTDEYYDVSLYQNGIVIYPTSNPHGIAIKSVFDDSVNEFIDADIDLSWRKTINSASITGGMAVVEFSCFENGDYENSVVKTAAVDLYK